jgi:hypothetical protein
MWRFFYNNLFSILFILLFLHLSLQYLTSDQTFSHFLRHVKGRLQVMQTF